MSTTQGADPGRLRRAAVDLWFAIERMRRGNPGRPLPPPPGGDPDGRGDDPSGSGVPRRPAPMGGSAGAAVAEDEAE